MIHGSAALLPTQTNINPSKPIGAEYFQAGQTLLILSDGDKLRCATSYGTPQGWGVGTRHECHHDQAGYRLGYFEVVAMLVTSDEATSDEWIIIGELPNRKIPHWVFK